MPHVVRADPWRCATDTQRAARWTSRAAISPVALRPSLPRPLRKCQEARSAPLGLISVGQHRGLTGWRLPEPLAQAQHLLTEGLHDLLEVDVGRAQLALHDRLAADEPQIA